MCVCARLGQKCNLEYLQFPLATTNLPPRFRFSFSRELKIRKKRRECQINLYDLIPFRRVYSPLATHTTWAHRAYTEYIFLIYLFNFNEDSRYAIKIIIFKLRKFRVKFKKKLNK